jgi:predicted dehydrogenase
LQLADELRVPYFDDFDAALARGDVQLVSICAEPERRGRLAVLAARAGKHLYLDKEPAVTPAGCREVVAAVREHGVLSQTFSLVRSAAAVRAKQTVQAGTLGTLAGLHAELFFAKGIGGTADLSRPRQERPQAERFTFIDSKRELLCVGWYPLVLFQWLTGKRITSISGTTSNYFFAEHQRNDVEDFACLLLELEGGLEATITVGRTGWMSHPSHGIHQVHLVGTDKTVTIDAYRPRLEIYSDAPPWQQPEYAHPDDPMGFWTSTQREGGVKPKTAWWPVDPVVHSDAAYFLDCIEAGRESDVPAALGARTVTAILAAYEAAATGRTVCLQVA